MPYQMLVTISETEKKRVMQDMLDDMTDHATKALMLKLAKSLSISMEPEEIEKFVMGLRSAMTAKPERRRAFKAAIGGWPTDSHCDGNEENL